MPTRRHNHGCAIGLVGLAITIGTSLGAYYSAPRGGDYTDAPAGLLVLAAFGVIVMAAGFVYAARGDDDD